MQSDSSDEEYTYPRRENRTARKSTTQTNQTTPVVSNYTTRRYKNLIMMQ